MNIPNIVKTMYTYMETLVDKPGVFYSMYEPNKCFSNEEWIHFIDCIRLRVMLQNLHRIECGDDVNCAYSKARKFSKIVSFCMSLYNIRKCEEKEIER